MKNAWLPYQVPVTGLCFSRDLVPGGHSFASGSMFAVSTVTSLCVAATKKPWPSWFVGSSQTISADKKNVDPLETGRMWEDFSAGPH